MKMKKKKERKSQGGGGCVHRMEVIVKLDVNGEVKLL